MNKETDKTGTEDKDRVKSSANTVKKPSIKLEVICALIAWAAVVANTLYLFLLGYNMYRQSILTVGWFAPGWIIYLVLPVSAATLSFRFYFFWPFFSFREKAIRILLLSAIILPIFWRPLSDNYVILHGVKAGVEKSGGVANLQNWAVDTIEKVSRDVNDINDLNGREIGRQLWSEQVRKLDPVNTTFHISDKGIPFIHITLAISWASFGILVGPPNFQIGDANTSYPYEFCPGVYGS